MVASSCALSWICAMGKAFLDLLEKFSTSSIFAGALGRDANADGSSFLKVPSEAERGVRKAGCNALVSALVFLMELENQNIGRCILVIAESQDRWHSNQNIELRSAEGFLIGITTRWPSQSSC